VNAAGDLRNGFGLHGTTFGISLAKLYLAVFQDPLLRIFHLIL
jgi:hypothetical protein